LENIESVKIGIAGVGAISQVAYLPILSAIEGLYPYAICDNDIVKAKAVANKYNVSHIYDDYEDLIRNPELDAVIIATPNYLHYPMIMSALDYGKDILCEMPLCLKTEEMAELEKTAETTDRIIMPVTIGRFREDVKIFKSLISSGELGSVSYSKAGWLKSLRKREKSWKDEKVEAGGGVIMTLGLYVLDYVVWTLGRKISSVYTTLHRTGDVEDSGIMFLKFDDGTFTSFEVSWTILFEKDFTFFNIYCEKGTAILNPFKIEKLYDDQIMEITPKNIPRHPFIDAYNNILLHFRDAVRRKVKPAYSVKDANYLLSVIKAGYRSFEEGKEVKPF